MINSHLLVERCEGWGTRTVNMRAWCFLFYEVRVDHGTNRAITDGMVDGLRFGARAQCVNECSATAMNSKCVPTLSVRNWRLPYSVSLFSRAGDFLRNVRNTSGVGSPNQRCAETVNVE